MGSSPTRRVLTIPPAPLYDLLMAELETHKLDFVCIHCGRPHEVDVYATADISIGTVIEPSPGNHDWGRCRFCHKGGLKALTEIPKIKKGPIGWRKIPKK